MTTPARIPRSTASTPARRGPVKARRAPGELDLVPAVPRQVRRVVVVVEQLDDGLLRFTAPRAAPGWTAAARTPVDVVRTLRALFTESQAAAYATWKGTVPDLLDDPAAPPFRRHKPRSRGRKRRDVYAADLWRVDERGRWVSPGAGHRFPENTQVVERVKQELKRQGLPLPTYAGSRASLEAQIGTQMALRLDVDPRGQL